MRNISRVLALLVASSFALGACQSPTATPAALATQPPPATIGPTAKPSIAASFKSKDPTTLKYLSENGPFTLDPALSSLTYDAQILENVYETLIFYNKTDPNSFVPQLATEVPSLANGGISADGKTYTFKIRSGVKFHNGDLLTPDDVAYTFQRGLLQGGTQSPQWLLFQPILGLTAGPNNDIADLVDPTGQIAASGDYTDLQKADTTNLLSACQKVTSAVVADDSAGTVTFHLAQAWGPFLATLAGAQGSITDKKWVGANGGWDGDCRTWQNFYAPSTDALNKLKLGSGENGTGPYVLAQWSPGADELVLKAFDGYWRTSPAWPGGPAGAPRLKTIILQFNVSQFPVRLNALRAGDADVIDEDSSSDDSSLDPLVGETCDASGACVPSADPSQPLRAFKGLPSVTRSDLFFNFKIDATGGNDFIGSGQLDGQGIPPDFFSDVHVRKAFNYCFDWDAYIKGSLAGEGVQSYDVMLPGELGYSDQDLHYSYDPDRCKAEFQASTLKSANGSSLWDTGFHFTIGYNSGNTYKEDTAQILKHDLAAVNPKFQVEVLGLPFQTYLDALNAHRLPLNLYGWLEDIHDPNDWVVPYVTGDYAAQQSLSPDIVQQLSPFINQAATETDPARRAAIYQQFNQAYFDAAPTILLVVEDGVQYLPRWVQGYYYNPIYPGFYFYALSKQ